MSLDFKLTLGSPNKCQLFSWKTKPLERGIIQNVLYKKKLPSKWHLPFIVLLPESEKSTIWEKLRPSILNIILDFIRFCLCWLYNTRLFEFWKRIFVFNDCPLRSFRKSFVIRELTGQNIPIKRFFCHRQETTGDYWHLKSMNCVAKRLCTPRTHSHDQMSQDSFSNHIVSPSLHHPLGPLH